MTYDLEAFLEALRPDIEHSIDAQIAAEPDPQDRALLRRHRALLIEQAFDANRVANLKNQLAYAEERLARLEPRPVEEEEP
jgi:hypothetical protein